MGQLFFSRKILLPLLLSGLVMQAPAMAVKGKPAVSGTALLQLRSFDAALNNGKVDFYWSTSSERNTRYFTVERSRDGELWAEVARVEGAGTTSSITEYADFDPAPLQGISYYRLKITDADGKVSHSQPVVLKNNQVQAADNQAGASSFDLDFTGFGDEEVLVLVRDTKGNELYSKVYLVGRGEGIKAISLDHYLAAGAYLVVACSHDQLVGRHIVVE